MSEIELEEQILKITAQYENYLHGECQYAALYLSEKLNYPLGAYITMYEDIDCLIHACVIVNERLIIDVKGLRTIESMKDDFPENGILTYISKKDLMYLTRDTIDTIAENTPLIEEQLKNLIPLIKQQLTIMPSKDQDCSWSP